MPKVKLFGLVLIITTLILAMAVVVTETFEIRLHDPTARATQSGQDSNDPMGFPNPNFPNNGFPNDSFTQSSPGEPQFTSVPVIIPLGIAGALGSLLWFAPGSAGTKKASTTKYKRRKR